MLKANSEVIISSIQILFSVFSVGCVTDWCYCLVISLQAYYSAMGTVIGVVRLKLLLLQTVFILVSHSCCLHFEYFEYRIT